MIQAITRVRRNSLTFHANCLNLMMFLTGVILGCVLICCGGIGGFLNAEMFQSTPFLSGGFDVLVEAFITNGKFLMLLYLLSFMRMGALLTPLLFGAEGIIMGGSAAAVAIGMGFRGLILLAILFLFRLSILLPYGFLMGAWSISQSLAQDASLPHSQSRVKVLILTLAVLTAASFLECTVAQWLARIYFLKVGV